MVNYLSGDVCLSWYRVGCTMHSRDVEPPRWPIPTDAETSATVRNGIAGALASIVPAVGELVARGPEVSVRSGVIFAWGSSDIDDPHSGLHERAEIGIGSYGRYHSINTGKYTMAPLFARQAATRILGGS